VIDGTESIGFRYSPVDPHNSMNVRFGSKAVVQVNISLMSGFGSKADIKISEIHEI
jgi:hypothetical protein